VLKRFINEGGKSSTTTTTTTTSASSKDGKSNGVNSSDDLSAAAECDEVSETCQISVEMLDYRKRNTQEVNHSADSDVDGGKSSLWKSVDPAPPCGQETIDRLKQQLLDKKQSLFQRYRAMFSLRNRAGAAQKANDARKAAAVPRESSSAKQAATALDEAVASIQALCDGFDDRSAVFQHEIAFVMGQLRHPAAITSLQRVLADTARHMMVRHEAAEALGSIAGSGGDVEKECRRTLERYATDKEPHRIVRESCIVALDIADYWTSDEQFDSVVADD